MNDKENNNKNARQCTNDKCDSSRYMSPDKVFLGAY